MKKRKPDLVERMDEFAIDLLTQVKGNIITGVAEGGELKARVEVFNAVVRWTMAKHKMYPEDEKETELERLTRDLHADRDSGKTGSA